MHFFIQRKSSRNSITATSCQSKYYTHHPNNCTNFIHHPKYQNIIYIISYNLINTKSISSQIKKIKAILIILKSCCALLYIFSSLTIPTANAFKLGLAMRLFLLMRIDAHQMRINAHKPHQ